MFSSSRDFKPSFGEEEFEAVYLDMQRVYLVMLAKDTESPLAPRSDEVGKAEKKDKEKSESEAEGWTRKDDKNKKPVRSKWIPTASRTGSSGSISRRAITRISDSSTTGCFISVGRSATTAVTTKKSWDPICGSGISVL